MVRMEQSLIINDKEACQQEASDLLGLLFGFYLVWLLFPHSSLCEAFSVPLSPWRSAQRFGSRVSTVQKTYTQKQIVHNCTHEHSQFCIMGHLLPTRHLRGIGSFFNLYNNLMS